MVILNPWVFVAFIPLLILYKKVLKHSRSRQTHLLFLSLFFMLLAVARPALQNAMTKEKLNSQEFIIALDASYSMQADDLKPTRYDFAKEAIHKLIRLHPKDRFMLFAFTSNALLISPPSTDTAISLQALETLRPEYILTKSTSLKNLFKQIAKLPSKQKNLIIFSDGGDEHDVTTMIKILKNASITPYIVATATHNGSALKKDGKYIMDSNKALVVSRINPVLENIALSSDGKYYTLDSLHVIDTLSSDISQDRHQDKKSIEIKNYKELFYIPLLFALFFYFISITKLHQLSFILLFLLPFTAHSALLDFYHLKEANNYFQEEKFQEALSEYKSLEPSVKSYYNIATLYYKIERYKSALSYYSQIKTANIDIKEAIFYNMGNCAFKLKHYKKAQEFYIKALALKEDKDALYNLNLLRRLRLHESKKTPVFAKKKSKSTKTNSQADKKKSTSSSKKKSKSKRSAAQTANGSGKEKQKRKELSIKKKSTHKSAQYQLGYKAYEIINKGYANEKEPW